MSDETIEYTVELSGDEAEHQSFCERVVDYGGSITARREVSENDIGPVNGEVVKTTWVGDGSMLAWIEKDGVRFCETYDHVATEQVEEE